MKVQMTFVDYLALSYDLSCYKLKLNYLILHPPFIIV